MTPSRQAVGLLLFIALLAMVPGPVAQDDLVPAFKTSPALAARSEYESALRKAADAYWAVLRPAQADYSNSLADVLKIATAAGDGDEIGMIGKVVQGLAAQLSANAPPQALPKQGPKGTPSQVTWKYGEPAKKLIRVDEGFCFLSGIGGKFEGNMETVQIVMREGWWMLDCTSAQKSLWATATCIRFAK